MVYEVYLRHGEVVRPDVVRAEIPGIAVEASGRAYSLERAIIAAKISDLPAEQVVTNLAAVGIPAEVVEH